MSFCMPMMSHDHTTPKHYKYTLPVVWSNCQMGYVDKSFPKNIIILTYENMMNFIQENSFSR